MAVAFVSETDTQGSGGSVAVTAPAGIVAGNLLVAVITGVSNASNSAPSGWTLAGTSYDASSTMQLTVYTKPATGSEPGSYTFNAGSSTIGVWVGQYSGSNALDTTPTFTHASGSSLTAASQTPTVTGDVLLVAFWGAGSMTITTPAGMTARTTGGVGNRPQVYDKALATTTATGTVTTTGSFSNDWSSVSLLAKSTVVPPVTGTATIAAGFALTTLGTGSGAATCTRKAWLTLGSLTVQVEDPTAGYFCSMLDLGYPATRDVVSNRPDQHGAIDRTQYMGARTVNIQVEALSGAGARIDQVAAMFAPFMDPSARPTLTYVLDRDSNPSRQLTVRAAGWSWPITGAYQRSIQLQFVAADPVAYDPAAHTVTATPVTSGTITSTGDLAIRPRFRIIGPTTGPAVILTPVAGGPAWYLAFQGSFTIAAGHYIDIDTAARTVLLDGDPAQPRLSSLDWTVTSWQWLPAGVTTNMVLTGTATTGATQATATWQDGYLT